jgi:hypothetical protein
MFDFINKDTLLVAAVVGVLVLMIHLVAIPDLKKVTGIGSSPDNYIYLPPSEKAGDAAMLFVSSALAMLITYPILKVVWGVRLASSV